MALFGKNPKEEIIAVIDLASASVGGMLIKKTEGKDPHIISSKRISINFLMDVDFQAFWRCAANALNQVSEQLLKDYPQGPDKILCILSHIWIVSQTRIVKINKENPMEVTKEFLDKLVKNEIETFKMQAPGITSDASAGLDLVEYAIMRTSLNGYQVEKPIGKKAKRFSLYLHVSLVDKAIKEPLKDIFLKNFGNVDLFFHSTPFVVFNVLKNIINTEEGFLFIDIGGETSDISLVRRNILEETFSFPRGKNFLIRKMASEFKTFVDDAVSIINSYNQNRLEKGAQQKAQLVIQQAKKEWCSYMEKALLEISQIAPLPPKIFFVSGKNTLDEFAQCINDEVFKKFTILATSFELVKITEEAFKDHFSFKRSIDVDGDVFLMAGALFADKFI